MLLQSAQLPTRTDNQALAPNFLQLSTLSTLATIATSNATLTDLTVNGRILADPAKTTTLVFSTLTAANYLSTGLTTLSTATASYTALATALQTPALNTLYSAYTSNHSTLRDYTALQTAAVTANLTQTGDLKPLGPITVTGSAAFNSTLRADTARFTGPAGFATDLLLVSSLTVPTTLSTVLSWTGDIGGSSSWGNIGPANIERLTGCRL